MTIEPNRHIDPGALIGVLGGGQLGAMFAVAAHRLGYRVTVWDPDPLAPAHLEADRSITAAFSAAEGLTRFLDQLSAATYEWENVPAALCEQIERHVPLCPDSRVLRLIQDRAVQKRFLAEQGLPVAHFIEVRTAEELDHALTVGFPCVLKTAVSGYDGKGQWRIGGPDELARVAAELSLRARLDQRSVLEAWVPFVRELSVLVVRGRDGRCECYPVVENVHEAGILRMTTVPAPIERDLAVRAQELSRSVVQALGSVGVFCVELFQLPDGTLLVNEVAPRPHNSGHYTLDACTVSQFEQQVRALCGLPLGEVRLTSAAVMLNILGDEIDQISQGAELRALLAQPGVHLHVYRKRETRPRRKMGHVTVTREAVQVARAVADDLRKALGSPEAV